MSLGMGQIDDATAGDVVRMPLELAKLRPQRVLVVNNSFVVPPEDRLAGLDVLSCEDPCSLDARRPGVDPFIRGGKFGLIQYSVTQKVLSSSTSSTNCSISNRRSASTSLEIQ